MTDNAIAILVKKEMALDIIDLMRAGKNMKEACTERGIEERAFHNTIAKFPEIKEAMAEHVQARVASTFGNIIEGHVQNSQALANYAETLRDRLAVGVLADGAVKELITIDKYLQNTIGVLQPVIEKDAPPPIVQDADKARANKILAEMTGAKRQHVDITVERYRVEIGGQGEAHEVVEGQATDLPQLEDSPPVPQPVEQPIRSDLADILSESSLTNQRR